MTRDELEEKLSMAVCVAQICGFTVDGEHVLCDDPKVDEQFINKSCECRSSGKAVLLAIEQSGCSVVETRIWKAATHGIQSYYYGNSSPKLAAGILDAIAASPFHTQSNEE